MRSPREFRWQRVELLRRAQLEHWMLHCGYAVSGDMGARPVEPGGRSVKAISVDHPTRVDELGRVAFSRHVLEIAESVDAGSGGAVVRLEGTWGSGKTHLPSSLKAFIEKRHPLISRSQSPSIRGWVRALHSKSILPSSKRSPTRTSGPLARPGLSWSAVISSSIALTSAESRRFATSPFGSRRRA
jgi:hypothetical protein